MRVTVSFIGALSAAPVARHRRRQERDSAVRSRLDQTMHPDPTRGGVEWRAVSVAEWRFYLLNVPIMTLVGRAHSPSHRPIDMSGLPEWARRDRYRRHREALSDPRCRERASMIRAMLAGRVKLDDSI